VIQLKVFELKDEQHGVGRRERERLVAMFEDYMDSTCANRAANRITVSIEMDLKESRGGV
jgi:hypothetical protein